MNTRKFYFILTVALTAFLFLAGTGILYYISNMDSAAAMAEGANDNSNVNDFLKSFVIGKDPVNLLFLVGDKAEANTDTMMIVNFNPATDKLNILSIPRDTKVNISGPIPKVNSIYARKNGSQLLVNTLNSFLGINIKYYVYLNITTFRKVIDLLGGVDYNVPVDMDYDDPLQNLHIHLKKGPQHFDGIKAEQFLRFRHPNTSHLSEEMQKYYDGSDIKRINAQQNFIKEFIKQKANIKYLPKLNEIINTVYSNLETNITMPEILKLLKNISDFSTENVSMFTLPGTSEMDGGIWYYVCDRQQASQIVRENFNGKGNLAPDLPPKSTNKSAASTNKATTKTNSNNSSTTKETTAEPATQAPAAGPNPSNSESSIQGSTKPAP